MMLVETFVGPSTLEGVGIFAAQPIVAGTCIWKLDRDWDRILSATEMRILPAAAQSFIQRYGYAAPGDNGDVVIENDNGRFMNHSASPNTRFTDPYLGYAIIDIATGEEILCDYGEFDPNYRMLPARHFAPINR